jgi:hypothetical protein
VLLVVLVRRQDLDELGSLVDETADALPVDLARHGHLQ